MKKRTTNFVFYLYLLFFLLIGVTLLLGVQYIKEEKKKIEIGRQNELISIGTLKNDQISSWYNDELLDAKTISQGYDLIKKVELVIGLPSTVNKKDLVNKLQSLASEHNYQTVYLIDNKFNLLLSSENMMQPLDSVVVECAKKSFDESCVCPTNLYHNHSKGHINFDIVAPLINQENETLALIVFSLDPETFLYPLIQKWPLPSKTAETVLVCADGDSLVFLNELRHVKDATLKLKVPLANANIPAVVAIKGYKGIFEGVDYRNIPVLSYVDSVPGTPWFMVSKIDKEELMERSKEAIDHLIILIASIVVFLAFFLFYLITIIQRYSYKKLWQAQEEFKTTLYSIGDAVITTDKNGLVKYLNPVAEKLTGWKEAEAFLQPVENVFQILNEKTEVPIENPVRRVIAEGLVVGLANHTILVSKEGTKIPIADSGAPIFNKSGELDGVVLVFRDQTEENKNHFIIEENRRQLFTLMSNLPGMAYRCTNDFDWTMEFISKGCLELTGYRDEEILHNAEKSYGNLIHHEDQVHVWETVQQSVLKRSSYELEYRIQHKSGKLLWVWEKGQGIYNENNELIALEGFISDISERKAIERALQASEQLFQTLAENSSVGIFRTNSKGLTTYVNPKWCQLADSTPKVAMESGWLEKIHPDDKDLLLEGWTKAIQFKEKSVAEYRFVHSNGETHWVKGEAVPEIDEKGELKGYVGTITDITDIKHAEEQLINSNTVLRTIIDNIPDAVYMKDLDGRKLIANYADLKNIGVKTESDVINKTDFDLFPYESAARFWADDLKILQTGVPIVNREEKLVNNKGEIKWLLTSKIPFKNKAGKIIGLVGIGHDITRRKLEQEEMMQLSAAVAQSPVSIVITDVDSNIVYVNPKFTENTGYSFEEVKGKNPRIWKSGSQPEEFYGNMWNDLSSGKSWQNEIQNRKKNGELFWENAIISPIMNEKGEVINYVAVKEDISERKKMMQELIVASEKAVESDRLKTSFLANMSHEIRTPLNSILGFTSFITSDDSLTNEEKEEFTEIINKSADSLLQIINDIIDISSLETGQLKMVIGEFDPQNTIESAYKIFTQRLHQLNNSNLELRVLDFQDKVLVNTDKNRLMQILSNLVGNALKFTSSGYIEFGIEKIENGFVHFKVEDTGRGIEKKMQSVVFERFRQGEDTITRHFGGNGLGLSIVKNLIELMGGTIALESEFGKGSTFRFTIPMA